MATCMVLFCCFTFGSIIACIKKRLKISLCASQNKENTHTHTHTHTYIYCNTYCYLLSNRWHNYLYQWAMGSGTISASLGLPGMGFGKPTRMAKNWDQEKIWPPGTLSSREESLSWAKSRWEHTQSWYSRFCCIPRPHSAQSHWICNCMPSLHNIVTDSWTLHFK